MQINIAQEPALNDLASSMSYALLAKIINVCSLHKHQTLLFNKFLDK